MYHQWYWAKWLTALTAWIKMMIELTNFKGRSLNFNFHWITVARALYLHTASFSFGTVAAGGTYSPILVRTYVGLDLFKLQTLVSQELLIFRAVTHQGSSAYCKVNFLISSFQVQVYIQRRWRYRKSIKIKLDTLSSVRASTPTPHLYSTSFTVVKGYNAKP